MSQDGKALTLTIIIPAYNEERYLAGCLDSIAAQTVKPDEVIVVDNNSTDDTAVVAKRYPFVTLLSERQVGVTFARDRGFNAAKGDIIGRIDADTKLQSDWVADVKTLFTKRVDIDAVSGPTGLYDLAFPRLSLGITKCIRTFLYYIGGKEERYLFGSNMAIRKKAWNEVKSEVCHVHGIHEDCDLAIHLIAHGNSVDYSNKLIAQASVRRANSSLKNVFKYAFMQYKTYRYHGIFSFSGLMAGFTLLIVFPGLWFLHRFFDPAKRRFSIKRLFGFASDQRKLPMD